MQFKDIFRERYRVALLAARAGDEQAVVAALEEFHGVLEQQYKSKNGDSIIVKVELSRWMDIIGAYLRLAKESGLKDNKLREFFGLPALTGGGMKHADGDGDIDFTGILPEQPEAPRAETPAPNDGGFDLRGFLPEEPIVPAAEAPKAPSEAPIADMPPADEVIPPPEGAELPAEEAPTEPNAEAPAEELPPETVAETPALGTGEPQSLSDFIGQRHIVKVLMKEIAIAKAEGKHHISNILLFGNPGLGKTTLMNLIAKELDVKLVPIDGTKFRNSQSSTQAFQTLLQNIARENEPVVIAIDEIHALNDELQSGLLTLLEQRIYISPPDKNGVIKRIPIDEFTFIGATTDDDKVLATIKDRCRNLTFQLVDYSPEELAEIYRRKVGALGFTITEEAIETCIPRSRGSLRYVKSFVDGLKRELYDDNGIRISTHIDRAVAEKFFDEQGIDPIGLNRKDIEVLRAIEEDPSGAIGAETLSARIGLDVKKYLSEVEPFLVKIGFVNVSGRGRGLTEKAVNYLKALPKQ